MPTRALASPLAGRFKTADPPAQTAPIAWRSREDDMAEDAIPRRGFLKGAGAAGAAAATVLGGRSEPAQAQTAVAEAATETAATEAYLTLTAIEAAFLSAAYDTFIPADKLSPSGTDCRLVTYMDRPLAGASCGRAHLYALGPV